MSRYWSKLRCLKVGSVTLNENFRGKGASPTNDFWHQKSRVPELSYGNKIAEKFNRLSRVHQRHRQTTDRQTTDGRLIAYSERNVVRSLKRTGQDRTGKKSQNGYISPICGEAPTEAMYMKICVVGDVLDIITCAEFQNEMFKGYDFTEGRIFHFSY